MSESPYRRAWHRHETVDALEASETDVKALTQTEVSCTDIVSGTPVKAASDFSGNVEFGPSHDRPRRSKVGEDGDVECESAETDKNSHDHKISGADEVPNATTVTEGLPKRQFRLQKGLDVTVPTDEDNDEWFRTNDGDHQSRNDIRKRGHIQAVCQMVELPNYAQRETVDALDGAALTAWSSFGGRTAAVAGVLLATGFEKRGTELVKDHLTDECLRWGRSSGYQRREETLDAFCERLKRQAVDRGDVNLQ